MSLKSQIQEIIKKHSVLEYLSKRGHSPVQCIGGGKFSFLCPFDDHNENKPSFIVYTNAQYENWHCFGCCRGYNIINLVSFLDKISFSEAVEKLSQGIVISADDDIKYTLDRIKKECLTNDTPESDMNNYLMESAWQCLLFSQGVDFNESEMHIIDNYFAMIDKFILDSEFETIEQCALLLPDILAKRKRVFDRQQEIQKYETKKNGYGI